MSLSLDHLNNIWLWLFKINGIVCLSGGICIIHIWFAFSVWMRNPKCYSAQKIGVHIHIHTCTSDCMWYHYLFLLTYIYMYTYIYIYIYIHSRLFRWFVSLINEQVNYVILIHTFFTWWRHQMETFSALLAICAGNSPVAGDFPSQRPMSFGVFFDLRLNKRLRKQSWGWWFETPSRPLWRHHNGIFSLSISHCKLG